LDDHAASVALLQALQRDLAKVHARKICRHRNPEGFFKQSQFDRSRAVREPRRLDLHESSAALSRRNILSGRISERRFGNDFAGGAQPELHCALRGLCDCRGRSAGAIWFPSRWVFGTTAEGNRMKRFLPWIILAVAAACIAANWLPRKAAKDDFNFSRFGEMPVLVGGRVKPLDTVARNSLLIIHGKQELRLEDGRRLSAMQWLTDVLFNAPVADQYPVFVVQNADVLGLFGWQQSDRKFFSFAEFAPFLKQIDEQATQSDKLEAVQRSAYQSAILNLRNGLSVYQRLKNSIQPEGTENFTAELDRFGSIVPGAAKAARERAMGENFDKAKLDDVAAMIQRYERLSEMAYALAVPPVERMGEWHSVGDSLLGSVGSGEIHPIIVEYAVIDDAYRANDPTLFNQHVARASDWFAKEQPTPTRRASFEFLCNWFQPFSQSMTLYVLAFLLACASWLGWSSALRRSAFYILLLALAIHTFGLVSRMYLQERPPVTNLYSSAIFIGWGAVIVALILERIFRDGIGAACAGA